jgi:PAS domain S-box-containing protein
MVKLTAERDSFRNRMRPPYNLSTTILVAATVVLAVLGGIYSFLAYERLGRETLGSAQRWSESVAQLVAGTTTASVILNDIAAVESNLQQVALLPGISNIAIFRPDGRALVEVIQTGESPASEVGGRTRIAPPDPTAQHIPSRVLGDVHESWSVVNAGTPKALAWVRVQFSLGQRTQELNRLWLQSLIATLILVALVLASLYVILARALRPIRDLTQFAQGIPQNIGKQFDVAPTCVEANNLSQALNQASLGIAEQVARVQAIVSTAGEAIIGLDRLGMVTMANPAASSIFGRPRAELLGQALDGCVPGLNSAALRVMFGDGFGEYGPRRMVRYDLFGTRADGTPFPVEISLGEVQDVGDLRYTCIVRDVTDERAAQETSELYERALACSHNAVFITNAKIATQPIVYVNEAFQKITQLPAYKVLGGSMDILRGIDAQDLGVRELTLAVREQRTANVTLHQVLPDGNDLIAEVSLSPVLSSNGALTHFVGIVSDVTARVQAEDAMAKRRAQLDAIFSLSPDGFVLFDTNDRMVFANPAFETMTGLSWADNGQCINLKAFEMALGALCDTNMPWPAIDTHASESEPWQARLHLTRPQTRVVQSQLRRNIAGRRETILYFRDVTHETEVDRMKSEFLAAAAHELRTPMVSIFGFTELLLNRKFTEERQTDMLQTIHRQSGLLVKMINELLDLARIESRGGMDMQIAAHPLSDLINNSVKGLMRADTDRQVDVGEMPAVAVLIDPEKMQLAMNNLLSNAFKYSPEGGIVSLKVRVEYTGNEPFAIIEIRDQGIGMSPEQVARAFERFFRADASGNIPGTGLGLSLVKEVAGLHKGRVELSSELDVGTVARLWIPIAKEKSDSI